MTSLESLQFYTKVLTGMVLLLNIGLLLSIRMALKYARKACGEDDSEEGIKRWTSVKRGLALLILTVVCMNGGAVFANHRLVSATHEVAADLPKNSDLEKMLSALTRPQSGLGEVGTGRLGPFDRRSAGETAQ